MDSVSVRPCHSTVVTHTGEHRERNVLTWTRCEKGDRCRTITIELSIGEVEIEDGVCRIKGAAVLDVDLSDLFG